MTQVDAGAGNAPAKLFRGYDNVSRGMLSSSAVTGKYEKTDGRSTAHIHVCESITELSRALEIDASLSVSYLKAANISAKMKFVQELNVTANSVTIVVYATHSTGIWRVKDIALDPEADIKDAAKFVRSYGDSFVSAATEGGEYYAVYAFRTETREQQTKLTGELKAKGLGGGVTVNAAAQAKLTEFLNSTNVSRTFDQEITGITNPDLPAEDKLIEFALAFPKKTLDAPVTTSFAVSSYEDVPRFPDMFEAVRKARRHFLGEDGVLRSLAKLRGIQDKIAWLENIYRRYNYDGDKDLPTFKSQVDADVLKITQQITDWEDDPTGKFEKPQLPSLAKGEPALNYLAGQPPSYGGEGGGPFDFMSVGEALGNQVKIVSIRLADGGSRVHRLEVGYASDRTQWVKATGGSSGSAKEIMHIEDGHFPIRFNIRSGASVDRIEIHCSDGRWTWAGGDSGAPYEWKVPEGSVVLGFTGRSGAVIDQIKIIHAALKPAKYVRI
ncbi:MAG TPA: hypothetical protein VJS15_01995 [Allosphingosinicella sp.]|nr:hypothetical protein [Allosphingosinicella sp.]